MLDESFDWNDFFILSFLFMLIVIGLVFVFKVPSDESVECVETCIDDPALCMLGCEYTNEGRQQTECIEWSHPAQYQHCVEVFYVEYGKQDYCGWLQAAEKPQCLSTFTKLI